MKQVGILGSGEVGQTLAEGFKTHGYTVKIGSRTPAKLADFSRTSGIEAGTFADVASWGEILVLSVQGGAAQEALTLANHAHLRGKIIIDTTNPIAESAPVDGVLQFFTGPNESLMEALQVAVPEARLVKAFNSVGSRRMVNPGYPGGPPTMFFCGNDAAAKAEVAKILEQFGWEPADMGTAVAARAIEPLCQLWCIPGFRQNRWNHAFKMLWG
ncbi:MAG TPA: NAD(P)-binding domain-containing protein [Candidatus Udaeobacter sp.]|nr:NAD(P)-binding domain-containing protein [Candidatus Udaeobacter sp.]